MRALLEVIDPGFALTGWSEWDSVHYLLTAPCVRSGAARFMDGRRQSVNWTGLRRVSKAWSHSERLLVALAQNLWNGTGHPSVKDLIGTLDNENFARALGAIVICRDGRTSLGVPDPGGER